MIQEGPAIPISPIFIPIWAPHDFLTAANLAVYLRQQRQPPARTIREWVAGYTPIRGKTR